MVRVFTVIYTGASVCICRPAVVMAAAVTGGRLLVKNVTAVAVSRVTAATKLLQSFALRIAPDAAVSPPVGAAVTVSFLQAGRWWAARICVTAMLGCRRSHVLNQGVGLLGHPTLFKIAGLQQLGTLLKDKCWS